MKQEPLIFYQFQLKNLSPKRRFERRRALKLLVHWSLGQGSALGAGSGSRDPCARPLGQKLSEPRWAPCLLYRFLAGSNRAVAGMASSPRCICGAQCPARIPAQCDRGTGRYDKAGGGENCARTALGPRRSRGWREGATARRRAHTTSAAGRSLRHPSPYVLPCRVHLIQHCVVGGRPRESDAGPSQSACPRPAPAIAPRCERCILHVVVHAAKCREWEHALVSGNTAWRVGTWNRSLSVVDCRHTSGPAQPFHRSVRCARRHRHVREGGCSPASSGGERGERQGRSV
jgi:hypothetical protein